MKNGKKSAIVLAALLVAVFVCMLFANAIQTGGGSVRVTEDSFQTDGGELVYKLYTPLTATAEAPAPAVLLLHGYQNDHETCAAYAMELARRGVVVMALDEYGHGSSEPGLLERGYVNHKVTVNYGEDSEEAGTYVQIGGQTRYKVMMNFSNLSFFEPHYSTDEDGNSITDSSAGGIAAYGLLASFPNVDATRIGLSGHSMGTWSSWSVAAALSGATNEAGEDISPKAVVLQCGELFRSSAYDSANIKFNNVLLLQAKYDEFSYFRDYKPVVSDELLSSPLRMEFLGVTEPAQWNTTYGSFDDGSARRMELLMTNHRLTTHNAHGLATALDWFDQAIGIDTKLAPTDQTAMTKEWLVLAAMLCAVAAMLPLMELLLGLPFFQKAAQPLPPVEHIKSKGKWWKGAVITMLIAGCTYPFMTQLGHGLLPLPEGIFRMTVGNGFLAWYLLLILVMLLTNAIAHGKAKKKGTPDDGYYGMGLGTAEKPGKLGWGLLGRSALLALCMLALLYVLVFICQKLFLLDFRFIWPFFKSFNLTRLGQFCVYIPVFALFFILNNSKIMASSRCKGSYEPGFGGFMSCWWRNALMMVGGILLIVLIEYIPFFMDIGPGADLLFGSTFGGPFMSLLILFVPQVLVFSVIGTYIYRRTGSVYIGALTIASMACWIVTGGSSML